MLVMPAIPGDNVKLPLLEPGGILGGSSRIGRQPQDVEKTKEMSKKREIGHIFLTSLPAWWKRMEREENKFYKEV